MTPQEFLSLPGKVKTYVLRKYSDSKILCEGGKRTYAIEQDLAGEWGCNCPASEYGGKCKHLIMAVPWGTSHSPDPIDAGLLFQTVPALFDGLDRTKVPDKISSLEKVVRCNEDCRGVLELAKNQFIYFDFRREKAKT